jgi:hypothetical protein
MLTTPALLPVSDWENLEQTCRFEPFVFSSKYKKKKLSVFTKPLSRRKDENLSTLET